MSKVHVDNSSSFFRSVCEETDTCLTEYFSKNEENLQFPALLALVNLRMKLDTKKLKDVDPFIRYFVRNHPEYHVSRGAKGGIMKKEVLQKKVAAKDAKEAAKKQLVDQIDAKIAKTAAVAIVDNTDTSSSDE